MRPTRDARATRRGAPCVARGSTGNCESRHAVDTRPLLAVPLKGGRQLEKPNANSSLDAGTSPARPRARRGHRAAARWPAHQSRPDAAVVGAAGAKLECFPAYFATRALAFA